jgi:cytochrome c
MSFAIQHVKSPLLDMTASPDTALTGYRRHNSWQPLIQADSESCKRSWMMRSLLALPMAAIAVGFAVAPGNCVEAGNAAQGEHAFVKCAVCHAKGKTNGIGPGLSGVIGRHAGSVPGFHYSEAMKNSTVVWDEKSLDAFVMAPQKALPGTIMPFPGIPGEEERKDLIAYLETLK